MRRQSPHGPSATCALAPKRSGTPASARPPRRLAAEQKRREEEAQRARRARLDAIVRRGESVWREIETEIERRNAAGYDEAVSLLLDLQAIAKEKGALEDFIRRLQEIRGRHARKERLIERLAKLG